MVLAKFRQRYPQGSLVGELVDIDRGTYIVRVSIEVDNIILATGLAAADKVETAEDAARARAIAALVLDNHPVIDNDRLDRDNPIAREQTIVNPSPVKVDPPQLNSDLRNNGHLKDERESVNIPDEPAPQPARSDPSPVLDPEPQFPAVPEPIVEIETISQPVEDSGNLFAGTQASETTVEQLLADGANLSAIAPDSEADVTTTEETPGEIDFTEMKHQTDLEIKRLGWTKDDGQEFLRSRYGKRSRLQLTDEQLWEFLQYLKAQPNPN